MLGYWLLALVRALCAFTSLCRYATDLGTSVRSALLNAFLDLVARECTDGGTDGRGQIAIADIPGDGASDDRTDSGTGDTILVARLVHHRFFIALLAHRRGGGCGCRRRRRGNRRRLCGSGRRKRGRAARALRVVHGRRVLLVRARTVLGMRIVSGRVILDHRSAALRPLDAEELICGHAPGHRKADA